MFKYEHEFEKETYTTLPPMPTAQLANGLIVANFSSPHPFRFEDGTVLKPCTPERTKALALHRTDVMRCSREIETVTGERIMISATQPVFEMSDAVKRHLHLAAREILVNRTINIVLVPLPVMKTMWLPGTVCSGFSEDVDALWPTDELVATGFRTSVVVDRVAKICSTTEFGC